MRVRGKADGSPRAAAPGLRRVLHGEVEAIGLDADGGGIGEVAPAEDAGALDGTLGGIGGQEPDLGRTQEGLAGESHRRRDASAGQVDPVHGRVHRLALLLREHGWCVVRRIDDVSVLILRVDRFGAGAEGEAEGGRESEGGELLHGFVSVRAGRLRGDSVS